MATTREQIDGKGKSLLELLRVHQSSMSNLINPSPTDGGTYDGPNPDDPVNISWPTNDSRIGKEVGINAGYYLREFNLENVDRSTIGSAGDGVLTEDEHAKGGFASGAIRVWRNFQGKEHNQPFVDDNTGYATDRSKFMVRSSRKSLATILQETWNAFFDTSGNQSPVYRDSMPQPGDNAAIGNKYSNEEEFKRGTTEGYEGNPRYETVNYGKDESTGEQIETILDLDTFQPVEPPGAMAANEMSKNRYAGGERSYDYTYMRDQGQSYVDEPSPSDVLSQARQGFVLGQIYGGVDPSAMAQIRREAQDITADYFRQSAANTDDPSLQEFYKNLADVVGEKDRISQLYVPGWGRPAENYLTRKPLSETLNQNLLLPPPIRNSGITSPLSMPGNTNDNGTGPPGHGLTEKTFQTLYTRNRAGKVGGVAVVNPIFNNGILGGSAINLLQEPIDRSAAMIKADPTAPVPATTQVPFSFVKDDAQYLTYDRKETGFTSNGPNTNAQPSKMEPAVDDVSVMGTAGRVSQADLARETIQLGQGQFFPFTFSTLNKKNHAGAARHQVCYLQAIINSLGESYTPTWASKHFFGRTEQVHTYTFTDRTIDLSFTIFANEMRQLQNVYERVLWLAQQCYPDFDNTGRVSEGPLVALRVGDLFQYKAGLIRSLSYDWMFAGGKWEMTAGMRMPQGVTVTLSYQIIHNTVPSRDTDFYGGPAGGLNAATERYREIGTSGGPGSAFDSFETLEIDQAGYGLRLIPEGQIGGPNDARSFLEDVKARNYVGVNAEDLSSMKREDLKVPTAPIKDAEGNIIDVEWAR